MVENCVVTPPLKIWKYYASIEQVNHFNPYIASITSIFLLLEDRFIDSEITGFITWYIDRINSPDKYGLSGTVYDYIITCDGMEKSLEYYDSADGYAGLFLTLNYIYFLKTKDKLLMHKNLEKLKSLGYLIASLKNDKGLTISSPENHTNYLMNNVEAYGGLVSLFKILQILKQEDYRYYYEHAVEMKRNILDKFYDYEEGNFFWAIKEGKKFKMNKMNVYPDVFAQMFPLMYGLLSNLPVVREQTIDIMTHHLNPLKLPKEQYFFYRVIFKMERIFCFS